MKHELGNTPADKNYFPSGMTKAEEKALAAYATHTPASIFVAYRDGYEQAEKDSVLAVDDIKKIDELLATHILDDIGSEGDSLDDYYTIVLKEYNEWKNDKSRKSSDSLSVGYERP